MQRVQALQQKQKLLLKDILRTAQQTNQMAINTNLQLHGQSQKMKGMDQKLNKINNTVDKSEQTAKEINSYWYYLKNKVKKALGVGKKPAFSEHDEKDSKQPSYKQQNPPLSQMQHPFPKQQNQQDEMLDEIIAKVKQTRGHCMDMGHELDHQKQLIDKLDYKTDRANNKITKLNKFMGKILNK